MKGRKVGVWIVGAFGSIASAMILGALSMRKGMTGSRGMVTGNERFSGIGLPDVELMEFGGCDIRRGSLKTAAREVLATTGIADSVDLERIQEDLTRIELFIQGGTHRNCGDAITCLCSEPSGPTSTIRHEITAILEHLRDFQDQLKLDEVVVVNLASTEPMLEMGELHNDLQAFEAQLDLDSSPAIRASTIYAYAAISGGYPYVNFTPSNGALFPAMVQFAQAKGVPVMGNDGKTGETLVKSALAPMFACRDLEVLSLGGVQYIGEHGRPSPRQSREPGVEDQNKGQGAFSYPRVFTPCQRPYRLCAVSGRSKNRMGFHTLQGISRCQDVAAVSLAGL